MDFEIRHGWYEDQSYREIQAFGSKVSHSFLYDHHVASRIFDAGFDFFDKLINGIMSVEVGAFETYVEPEFDGMEEVG
jgi:hypothetical protein